MSGTSERCTSHADWAACSGPRQVLSTTVSVCFQEPVVSGPAQALLREFPPARTAAHPFLVSRGGDPDSDTHVQLFDGRRMAYDGYCPTACATLLMTRINTLAMRAETAVRSVLHAGAVRRGDGVVALPAAQESGKTTLVAGLLDAGFDYLTDELAPLDEDLRVLPYPKPLSVDRGSWPVLPRWAPDRPDTAAEQWLVHPRAVSGRAPAAAGSLQLVVLPRYSPAAPATAARPLVGSRALLALLACAFDFEQHPGRDLERLADVVRSVPVYELAVRELAEAVETVAGLVKRHA